MRRAYVLALLFSACTYQVSVDVPLLDGGAPGPDASPLVDGAAPDLAIADLATPDLAMPDLAMADLAMPDFAMPDLVPIPPVVRFSLDARSSTIFNLFAQPLLDAQNTAAAHYTFDEMAGALKDHTANGNDLGPLGGLMVDRQVYTHLPTASGFSRVAMQLVASGFAAANGSGLDVTAEDFTVEAWLKLAPGYAPAGCDPIVTKGTSPGYQICVAPGGKLQMSVSWNGGSKSVTSDASFADGAWHLVAFVFKLGAANQAALYVDGKDLTPAARDLSLPMGVTLSNTGKFTVGGDGKTTSFGGSLAELVFFDGRAMTLADAAADVHAFLPPVTMPGPHSTDLAYAHDGTVCSVVGADAMGGDRVACFGGGNGLAAQFAVAFNPNTDKGSNAAQLGMLTAPGGANDLAWSEQFDKWTCAGLPVADSVISPRGDRTAEHFNNWLPNNYCLEHTTLSGNQTVTLSAWLKSGNGASVSFVVEDTYAIEASTCTFKLSPAWKRYQCTGTFSKKPSVIEGVMQNLSGGNVTFDAWGGQLEVGPTAGPYVPNGSATTPQARAPIVFRVRNAQYLDGGAGRVEIGYTGDAAMPDQSYLFDTDAGADRRYVRRGANKIVEAEVLDTNAASAMDSLMASAPIVDWTLSHAVALSWSAVLPLPMNARHTGLIVDGSAMYGRQAAYAASAPANLYIGTDAPAKAQPLGTLQTLKIWTGP